MLPMIAFSQQEKYTNLLNDIVPFIQKNDIKGCDNALVKFVSALNSDKMTPEKLSDENRQLFMNVLFKIIDKFEYIASEDVGVLILPYSRYKIDESPLQMFITAFILCYNTDFYARDMEEGTEWLLKAANNGNGKAMAYLGELYNRGAFLDYEPELALEWLKKGAKTGDTKAMYLLGEEYFYDADKNVSNLKTALQWFELAAAQDYVDAAFMAGIIYKRGIEGIMKPDYKKAKGYFEKACQLGHEKSCGYAQRIQYLIEGKSEYTAYFNAITKALNDDNMDDFNSSVKAYLEITNMGGEGEEMNLPVPDSDKERFTNILYGIFKNPFFAFERFKASISWSNLYLKNGSQWFVYGITEYIKEDYESALRTFKTAADMGSAEAMFYLSKMYYEQKGTKQNIEESFKWCQKAANLGFDAALFRAGNYYEFGVGVEKDMAKANEYYKKACDKGIQEGCDKVKQ